MGNTSKNTDEKQRAYKKAKKLRRKIRKAEELKRNNNNGVQDKEQPSKSDNKLKWSRVGKEDAKKAVDRPLDQGYNEDRINELLEKRTAAKLKKNYKVSDEITQTLIKLQIIYDDDKKQWHTRQWKSNNF